MTITPTYGAPRNRTTITIAVVTAAMFTLMLVSQLFGYEDLASELSSIMAINDIRLLQVVAGVVVLLELLALPYLLGMYLSQLLRFLSAAAGFGVAGFWLLMSLTNAHIENSGIFASTIELPGGVLAALWSFLLFGLICRVIVADSKFRHAVTS